MAIVVVILLSCRRSHLLICAGLPHGPITHKLSFLSKVEEVLTDREDTLNISLYYISVFVFVQVILRLSTRLITEAFLITVKLWRCHKLFKAA